MHLQHADCPLPVPVFPASAVPGPRPLPALVVLALSHLPSLPRGCDSYRVWEWVDWYRCVTHPGRGSLRRKRPSGPPQAL